MPEIQVETELNKRTISLEVPEFASETWFETELIIDAIHSPELVVDKFGHQTPGPRIMELARLFSHDLFAIITPVKRDNYLKINAFSSVPDQLVQHHSFDSIFNSGDKIAAGYFNNWWGTRNVAMQGDGVLENRYGFPIDYVNKSIKQPQNALSREEEDSLAINLNNLTIDTFNNLKFFKVGVMYLDPKTQELVVVREFTSPQE